MKRKKLKLKMKRREPCKFPRYGSEFGSEL